MANFQPVEMERWEFVWPIYKTRAHPDSMFKEFPISTFLSGEHLKLSSALINNLPSDIDKVHSWNEHPL